MEMSKRQETKPAYRVAGWAQDLERSLLRQMVGVVSQPGILSFAGGLPANELFPNKPFAEALAQVLSGDQRAMQYGSTPPALLDHICDLMALRGVDCQPDQLVITTGAQQGLQVATQLLLNYGGRVVTEEIIYTGIRQVIRPLRAESVTVSTDLKTGLDVAQLADLLAQCERESEMPAFIYAIPDAHNPLGVSMSLENRKQLVGLARRYQVPLVEDDPYGLLAYDHAPHVLPPLRALDPDWVIYLGSFSKIIAPGLRLGWMAAPKALLPRLQIIKDAADLETSGLMQKAVAAYLEAGHLPLHLTQLRAAYSARRDVMLGAMGRHFPASATWTRPRAGMFIWAQFPPDIATMPLLHAAVDQEKVAYIPGIAFADAGAGTDHPARSAMRLSFSNSPLDQIETGIRRLGRLLVAAADSPDHTPDRINAVVAG
jgi:2-aminoadipate transaminase